MDSCNQIIKILQSNSSEESKKGMARYGISVENAFGTGIPLLRTIAKEHKKNHELALQLWKTGYHEARILASIIDDPLKVDENQLDFWVANFYSWDLCDQCCMNLFCFTPFAWQKAIEWSNRPEEFVKRASFALMASLSLQKIKAENASYFPFFEIIYNAADDNRPMVKKAVNWALRQIGKRNFVLNNIAIQWSEKILLKESKSAKWIASDALKELKSKSVQIKIDKRQPFL